MSKPQPQPQPTTAPPSPYQPEQAMTDKAKNQPAGNVPFIAQMVIGFGAFLVLIGAGVATIPVPNFRVAQGILIPFSILCLIVLCMVARVRWHWKGFLLGVLIGAGLILLAVGLCFAMFLS